MVAIAATSIRASEAAMSPTTAVYFLSLIVVSGFGSAVQAAGKATVPAAYTGLDSPRNTVAQTPASAAQRAAENQLLRLRGSSDPRDAARAEQLIQHALKLAPQEAKSWELKGWGEMSAHRFQAALAALNIAQKFTAQVGAQHLGLRADALVELGDYEAARTTVQAMLDRFPGAPAYSRAAYLRFLYGDMQGAISLMQDAWRAAKPGSEDAAWLGVQLSTLYLQAGQLAEAEAWVVQVLNLMPGHLAATTQFARVKVAQGHLQAGMALYKKAADKQLSVETAIAIHDLAQRLGLVAEAQRQAQLINALARLDEKNGGLNRRALALFFAEQAPQIKYAERLARLEWKVRPDIYSEQVLGWVLYRAGKLAQAAEHMQRATRLETADPELSFRAGVVLNAAGQSVRGTQLLSRRYVHKTAVASAKDSADITMAASPTGMQMAKPVDQMTTSALP